MDQNVLVIEEKHLDGLLGDAWKLWLLKELVGSWLTSPGGAEGKMHVNLVRTSHVTYSVEAPTPAIDKPVKKNPT